MTVINKSFEILMAPPTHLMSLMLTVAARITAGQKSGAVLGSGEGGERIPVQWDLSDETEDSPGFHQQQKPPAAAAAPFSSGRRWSVSHVGNDDDHLPPHMRGRERGMSLKMAGSFPESDEESENDDNGNTSSSTHDLHEPAARRIGAAKADDDGLRLDGITEDDPKFDWSQSMGVD